MLFRNTYFALRHGRSTANEAGIIVADPARGVPDYGLSESGKRELRAALLQLRASRFVPAGGATICVSSDFRRARETADMFCALVGAAGPILSESLRERSFGKLEGESHLRYNEVWQEDARSRDHHLFGSESPADVSARLLEFLGGMEVSYDGNSVVVVAHGDILQILQTIFAGMECNRHRDLPHLEPGELRRLN